MISFAPTILCLRLTCLAKSNLWRMTAWQILHWNNRGFKCIRSTWTLATPVFEYHCPQITHWPRPSSLEATIWESKLDVGNICAAASAVPVTEDNPTNNNKVFVQNWFHEIFFLILLISRFFYRALLILLTEDNPTNNNKDFVQKPKSGFVFISRKVSK